MRRSYEASVKAEQKKMKQSAFDVYEKRKLEFQTKMLRQLESDYKSIALISDAIKVYGTQYRDVASRTLIGEFMVEILIYRISKLIDN